ncbi:hypothetical protein Ahy_A03g016859 isoform B [Arachis hypogaea]|uniref:Uncharacterized protein n=1 Tax=Arachis hypogaea TaxID=3818 RepID=A0A445E4P4_ARAHY|nr:hypothetical protein Ahy_A03g016859 isoform B [Arachis hypogaea]
MASLLSEYTTPTTDAFTTPVDMFTLFPNAFTFSGSLSGSFPATVCTGFAKESKLLLATNSGSMWNCTSSIFCFSSNEFRNPALRLEKASSSGARIVMPPVLAVMSCELMLFIISVVFIRRIRTLKIFAFFRIFVMSSGAASDESGDCGSVGTNGFGDGAFFVVAFGGDATAFGAGFGDAAEKYSPADRVLVAPSG